VSKKKNDHRDTENTENPLLSISIQKVTKISQKKLIKKLRVFHVPIPYQLKLKRLTANIAKRTEKILRPAL